MMAFNMEWLRWCRDKLKDNVNEIPYGDEIPFH